MNLIKNFLGKKDNKTADPSSQRSGQAYQTSTSASKGPQIYVLPYPPPPSMYSQPSNQTGYSYQNRKETERQPSTQSEPNDKNGNGQSRKSGQTSHQSTQPTYQQYAQPGYQQPAHPGHEQPTQPGYQQPKQPGYQQPHGQPPPNGQYAYVYPGQPASAQDAPAYRQGPWRRQSEEESTPEGWESFKDQKVRSVFVRKVYSILMLQLLFTLGIIALFVFEPNVKRFVQENKYLYYMALAIFIAVMLGIACCENLRRTFPTNIILLTIFTMAMSYMMGTISGVYNTEAVFMAVGITAAVCLLVSIFSFHTKFDFTTCGGILCILLLVLILFGIIAIFIPSKVMLMIYSALGAIVFTLYLAYDTQMIMGGKSIEISPEEYVLAAMQLYIDIAYIFIHLLMLIGLAQE